MNSWVRILARSSEVLASSELIQSVKFSIRWADAGSELVSRQWLGVADWPKLTFPLNCL